MGFSFPGVLRARLGGDFAPPPPSRFGDASGYPPDQALRPGVSIDERFARPEGRTPLSRFLRRVPPGIGRSAGPGLCVHLAADGVSPRRSQAAPRATPKLTGVVGRIVWRRSKATHQWQTESTAHRRRGNKNPVGRSNSQSASVGYNAAIIDKDRSMQMKAKSPDARDFLAARRFFNNSQRSWEADGVK